MTWVKENKLFTSLVVLLALVFVAEVTWALASASEARNAHARLQAAARTLQVVAAADPTPTPENLAAVRSHLRDLEVQFDRFLSEIRQGSWDWTAEGAVFNQSQELYFDIVAFIENYQRRARENGITVTEAEGFGFSDLIANGKGPPLQYLPIVHLQKQVLSYLLSALYESHPDAITEVNRDAAYEGDGSAGGRSPGIDLEDSAGSDEGVSAPVSVGLHTLGFELVFEGRTRTLRAFLNRISAFERPLVVRSVEVRRLNRTRNIRIHAVLIHPEPTEETVSFFEGITEDSGGTFRRHP